MRKSRYYIAYSPSCDLKNALAKLSKHVLYKVESSFYVLQKFAEESHEQSPRRMRYYMLRNSENTFSPGLSRLSAYASTPCEVQSNQETSSPVKGESSFPRNQLPFGAMKYASEPENLETKTIIAGSQESAKSCEKAKMFSHSIEDDKTKKHPREERNLAEEYEENIQTLIKRNLVKITSISIIRQVEHVGVEIDIDVIYNRSEDSSEELGLNFGASSSPCRAAKKSKSPSSSPSKCGKSTRRPSVPSEFSSFVDFSNRDTLECIAKKLSDILSDKKTYMEQIYNSFLELRVEALNFYKTVGNIEFIVRHLPIKNEKCYTQDLAKMSSNLLNKADEILTKVESMLRKLDKEVDVLEKCVQQIYNFDENYGIALSENNEAVLDVDALIKLETLLKSICNKADGIVILEDDRKTILLKSSSDFEWLVKNFVKFLIITGMLMPLQSLSSEDVKEK